MKDEPKGVFKKKNSVLFINSCKDWLNELVPRSSPPSWSRMNAGAKILARAAANYSPAVTRWGASALLTPPSPKEHTVTQPQLPGSLFLFESGITDTSQPRGSIMNSWIKTPYAPCFYFIANIKPRHQTANVIPCMRCIILISMFRLANSWCTQIAWIELYICCKVQPLQRYPRPMRKLEDD